MTGRGEYSTGQGLASSDMAMVQKPSNEYSDSLNLLGEPVSDLDKKTLTFIADQFNEKCGGWGDDLCPSRGWQSLGGTHVCPKAEQDQSACGHCFVNWLIGWPIPELVEDRSGTTSPQERAQRSLQRAAKNGVVDRPSACVRCGKDCKPDGHHSDYSKPLEVEWLCHQCHMKTHAELKREGGR